MCNLQCEHCLRGCRQLVNIERDYLRSFFNQVSSVGYLVFSGGEPSLNTKAIVYSLELMKQYRITLDYFGIVTNGIRLKPEFAQACKDLYNYSDIKSLCSLQLSNDYYHLKQRKYDDSLVNHFPFYRKRNQKDGDRIEKQLHREGKGESIPHAAVRSSTISRHSYNFPSRAFLYLNALGMIVNGVDWSYDNQDDHIICPVDELTNYYSQKFNVS